MQKNDVDEIYIRVSKRIPLDIRINMLNSSIGLPFISSLLSKQSLSHSNLNENCTVQGLVHGSLGRIRSCYN